MTHEQGKGVIIGKCPECGELISIDLINNEVEDGKFEIIPDGKHEKVFITCPKYGHRAEEPRLMTNIA